MRLANGSKVYFSYVNLKGYNYKYRHPSIRFIVVDPARAQDSDDSMYGHLLMEFQYQTNGGEPSNDWYGGSIEGLVSVSDPYALRDVNKILRAWEK